MHLLPSVMTNEDLDQAAPVSCRTFSVVDANRCGMQFAQPNPNLSCNRLDRSIPDDYI